MFLVGDRKLHMNSICHTVNFPCVVGDTPSSRVGAICAMHIALCWPARRLHKTSIGNSVNIPGVVGDTPSKEVL